MKFYLLTFCVSQTSIHAAAHYKINTIPHGRPVLIENLYNCPYGCGLTNGSHCITGESAPYNAGPHDMKRGGNSNTVAKLELSLTCNFGKLLRMTNIMYDSTGNWDGLVFDFDKTDEMLAREYALEKYRV